LDRGTGSDVGAVYGVVLAVAAQNHGRLRRAAEAECGRTARASRSGTPGTGRRIRTASRAGTGTAGRSGRSARGRRCAGASRTATAGSSCARALTAARTAEAAEDVEREAPDIAFTDGGVPARFDLASRL